MALTAQQLKSFSKTLAEQRVSLQQAISQDLVQTGEQHHLALAGEVMDAGDLAVSERLAELDIAFLRHHVHSLEHIEAAQRRIADGSYGLCPDCGNDIELRRLEANPTALRCVECQAIEEKRHPAA